MTVKVHYTVRVNMDPDMYLYYIGLDQGVFTGTSMHCICLFAFILMEKTEFLYTYITWPTDDGLRCSTQKG